MYGNKEQLKATQKDNRRQLHRAKFLCYVGAQEAARALLKNSTCPNISALGGYEQSGINIKKFIRIASMALNEPARTAVRMDPDERARTAAQLYSKIIYG